MNPNDIYDGITDIRDDLVEGTKSAPGKQKRHKKARWFGAAAAVLAIAIICGILLPAFKYGYLRGKYDNLPDMLVHVFLRPGGELKAYALAEAQYPQMAPYPGEPHTEKQFEDWWEDVRAQRRDLGDISSLQTFFMNSSAVFLSDTDGQNRVYSPLNVYMALSMLAQLTDGESCSQILSLLGSDSTDALRKQASDVWHCNYRDDGALTSILASSLWLNRDISFNQDTLDTLARDLYASSYQGEMGTDEYNKALQEWLTQQTGGLLADQAGNVTMDPETVLALATSVYFRAKWSHEFSETNTVSETFHSPNGDIEADFMHQRDDQNYYWGEHFAAISQGFEEGGQMWFILPDEGITPEELLSDKETVNFLFNRGKWENTKFLFVNKSIPKFDVASQFDLGEGLQKLGVTDVFDPYRADFTPMTTDTDAPIVLSSADHAARVKIDEEGCTAAAFTVMLAAGAAMPPDEEVDFVLDRPFLFCITGDSGLPLFVGIVNTPTGN